MIYFGLITTPFCTLLVGCYTELDRFAESMYLVYAQVAPATGLKVAQGQRAVAHALKLYDRVAHGGEHEAHLALAAFVDDHAQPGIAAAFADPFYAGGSGHLAFDLYA